MGFASIILSISVVSINMIGDGLRDAVDQNSRTLGGKVIALLEVNNLHTYFKTKGTVKAVNGASYSVDVGKTLGIVGESGSGKTVSAMSIIKLLDSNGYIADGKYCLKEEI